jgi:quinoprotein glucose dehydrogenase
MNNTYLYACTASLLAAVVGAANVAILDAQRARARSFRTWTQYGGGADSSQYSALDQINKSNVGRLEVAWTYPSGDMRTYRFNPIVVDRVMYLAANNSIVALDPTTGKEIWTHANQGAIGERGINYWENADRSDRRLLYINGGFLTAIDARTGETIASFGDKGRVDMRAGLSRDTSTVRPLQTSNPGRIFENLMIVSLPAGGAAYVSSPGDIHAYDVRTGKLAWVFHTVPEKAEFGADTWPAKTLEDGGGGVHNWSELTVDEQRGIVFIPLGTARYDFYGGNRKGNNLFGNSLLALDARTGKRLWHFQTVHHDLWDYDLPNAPKLLTVRNNGRTVDIVAQASKQGFLYVFERATGKPLWPIEERPVPQTDAPGEQSSPTQPIPTLPPPFARQSFAEKDIDPHSPEADRAELAAKMKTYRNEGLFTPPSIRGTIEMPGHNGGANWGSSAVDPARGTMYIVSKELPTLIKLELPGQGRGGARGGAPGGAPAGAPEGGGPANAVAQPPPNSGGGFVAYNAPYDFMLQSNGLSAIGPPWSQLTAYDLNTGTILWRVPNGEVSGLVAQGITGTGSHAPRGGPVVTAGGLVFAGTSSDRTLRAYDQDTGKVVWQKELPAAQEGVPAVYEIDGREYLVVCVGGGNGLFPQRVGSSGQPTAPPPAQYMAFALPRK